MGTVRRSPPQVASAAARVAAVALLILPATPIGAHELTQGVGTQTTFLLFPDHLQIELNLGFSASAGFPILDLLDTDGDDRVSEEEALRLPAERGPALLPFLDLRVNGRPLELRIVSSEEVGVRGRIGPRSFDTYYQVVAALPPELPGGGWWLHYRDGSFEGQTASQFCWLPWQGHGVGDYKIFEPLALEQDIGFKTVGRDLVLFFDDVFRAEIDPLSMEAPTAESLAAIPLGASGAPSGPAPANGGPLPSRDEPITPRSEQEPGEEARIGELVRALASGERSGFELLLALLLAVAFGAGHALGPGHGKSMVAAYLVGSRGRVRDAITLGAVVTFAHTASIYLLGLLLLWLIERSADRVAGATYQNWLTTAFSMLSGVLLLGFGLALLRRRLRAAIGTGAAHDHGHDHGHAHDHAHGHAHDHSHGHEHAHDHGHSHGHRWWQHSHPHLSGGEGQAHGHEHSHGPGHSHGHTHTHGSGTGPGPGPGPGSGSGSGPTPASPDRPGVGERARFGDLVALGLSGGIVPCPAGFTIMLVAAHYQALTLGLVILTFFSFGLGALLCGIGIALVLGKERILDRVGSRSRTVMRWLPVLSAGLVSVVGTYFIRDSYSKGRTEIAQMLRALSESIGG